MEQVFRALKSRAAQFSTHPNFCIDPGMMSVSGHEIQVDGILRNMVFNLKGSTVTYRRDVFVCSQLDGWPDMVAGAKFIAEQFAVLFSKAKKMFAAFSVSKGRNAVCPSLRSNFHQLKVSCHP